MENLVKSTLSSGAVIRSSIWPSSVCSEVFRVSEASKREIYLVKQLQHIDIVGAPPEAAIQNLVDCCLHKEGIVDGDVADTILCHKVDATNSITDTTNSITNKRYGTQAHHLPCETSMAVHDG